MPVLQILTSETIRVTYAYALKQSISLDINGNIPPQPASVLDIEARYGFSPRIQKEFFLAINKAQAKQFLLDMGVPTNTNFDRTYTREAYVNLFEKEPCIINRRQMLLTYAEWLHLVGFMFEPKFPDFLIRYL